MIEKKNDIWLPVYFAIAVVIGMFLGFTLRGFTGGNHFFASGKKNSLQEVMDLIESKYVDDVKMDSINELTISELLAHLDPHSIYIPSTQVKVVNDDLMGHFTGIGVEFQVFDDTVNVVNVIKDGPSDKAGILIGDKLIAINDTVKITGKVNNIEDIRKYLRGKDGSKVLVTILRDNYPKKIEITRGDIKVSTIDAAYMVSHQIGYIKINKFGDRTYEEFMQNLENLQKKGMQKLILDLRGNGGGLMKEAVDIADEFLDGNKMVVFTKGNNTAKEEYTCKRDGLFEKGKLVVWVDETSASASEVLSGALQDWDRAIIIGRRTFGKGLVQQQYQLSDGGALRLTVARYYSPLGRNIQKPYSNKSKKQYEEELQERYDDGEVLSADSIKQKGQSFRTPSGHLVYGGGGIVPDIFVATDTFYKKKALAHLYASNILNRYIFHFYISHKNQFKNVRNIDELMQQFSPNESNWTELLNLAEKEKLRLLDINDNEKKYIYKQLQGIMAKQIFRNEGYYELMNKGDKFLEQSLLIFDN